MSIGTRHMLLLWMISLWVGNIMTVHAADKLVFGQKVYHNGPYYILGCDWQLGPRLAQLLKQTGQNLERNVIPDANDNGGNSIYGYREMFGSIPGNTIADVFQDVDEGATETFDGRQVARPNLVCVREDVSEMAPLWAHCRDSVVLGATSPNLQDVFICPRFWDATYPDFPYPEHCPALNADGSDFADTDYIVNNPRNGHLKINGNKWSTIIHELMHKYVPASPDGGEKYLYHEVIRGGPDFQLSNPRNYEYYANFVLAKCTKFPKGGQYSRPSKRLVRRQGFANAFVLPEMYDNEVFVADDTLKNAMEQAQITLNEVVAEGDVTQF